MDVLRNDEVTYSHLIWYYIILFFFHLFVRNQLDFK